MTYNDFLEKKKVEEVLTGLNEVAEVNPMLFEFQKDITIMVLAW